MTGFAFHLLRNLFNDRHFCFSDLRELVRFNVAQQQRENTLLETWRVNSEPSRQSCILKYNFCSYHVLRSTFAERRIFFRSSSKFVIPLFRSAAASESIRTFGETFCEYTMCVIWYISKFHLTATGVFVEFETNLKMYVKIAKDLIRTYISQKSQKCLNYWIKISYSL